MVSLGGDISLAGEPPAERMDHSGHRPVRQRPRGTVPAGQTVAVRPGGLATSGTSARRWTRAASGCTTWSTPAPPDPADEEWRTVSVAAVPCVDANTASDRSDDPRGQARRPGWPAAATTPGWSPPTGRSTRSGDWPPGRQRRGRRRGGAVSALLGTKADLVSHAGQWLRGPCPSDDHGGPRGRPTSPVAAGRWTRAVTCVGAPQRVLAGRGVPRYPRAHRDQRQVRVPSLVGHLRPRHVGIRPAVDRPRRSRHRRRRSPWSSPASCARRLGRRAWRAIHWLAYVSLADRVHPLDRGRASGNGADTGLSWSTIIYLLTGLAFLAAVVARLRLRSRPPMAEPPARSVPVRGHRPRAPGAPVNPTLSRPPRRRAPAPDPRFAQAALRSGRPRRLTDRLRPAADGRPPADPGRGAGRSEGPGWRRVPHRPQARGGRIPPRSAGGGRQRHRRRAPVGQGQSPARRFTPPGARRSRRGRRRRRRRPSDPLHRTGQPGHRAARAGACAERGDSRVEVVTTPRRYASGQETALVDFLNGGPGARPFTDRSSGAWEAGPPWSTTSRPSPSSPSSPVGSDFGLVRRRASQPSSPSRASVEPPRRLRGALGDRPRTCSTTPARPGPAAVLVGGYFGRWLPGRAAIGPPGPAEPRSALGAGLGCGVVLAARRCTCAVDELARVAGWYAGATAPGSAAPAPGACATWPRRPKSIHAGRPRPTAADIARWTAMIKGRGACRLPDGAAAFLDSGMEVFADEIADHRRGRCPRRSVPPAAAPDPGAMAVTSLQTVPTRWSSASTRSPATGMDCAGLFPERISLDDWGYPILDDTPLSDELLAHARRAVTNCPALALRLERLASPARQ